MSWPTATKAETRQYIADAKAKKVHAEQLVLTLRSLVGSILSFDDAQPVKADSCTLAAAFRFVGKGGTTGDNTVLSNGGMEAEWLQRIKDRYVQHGLDY